MIDEEMQAEINEYVGDLKEKMIPITHVQNTLSQDDEFLAAMKDALTSAARYCKLSFDALVEQGFTEDQAIRIVAANDPTPKLSFSG